MQNLTETVSNPVLEDDVFVSPRAEGGGAAVELDPKSARKEAINDMKKAHIMDAALKVIARGGYASARLEDIAEEAGFSKAAIYHYFPDKDALFVHIMLREQRALYEKCVEIAGRDLSFLESVREFAFAFFDKFFRNERFFSTSGSPPSMMANFMTSFSKHEELLNESIMRQKETFGLLTQIIAKAKSAGVLTIPVDDKTVCLMMVSFFQSYAMDSLYRGWREGGAEAGKIDFNKAVDTLFIFLEPWIKDASKHRRWYDVTNS